MAVIRFLQVSDFHLGRPFGWLPPDKRADRRSDQRRALDLSVRQAIERGAHAILLPGDLFHEEAISHDLVSHRQRVGVAEVYLMLRRCNLVMRVFDHNPHLLQGKYGLFT